MSKTAKGIERYGRIWDGSKFIHPGMIDLFCYARYGDKLRDLLGSHCLDKSDFMRSAIRTFFSEHVFRLNPWANRMIDLWCNEPVGVVWGCSGSGKSTSTGMIVLMDLLPCPTTTYTCLVTSPQKEHPNRTWGNVVKYYNHLPEEIRPGVVKQAPLGLHTTTTDKRAGVHCYSTEPGESVEDFKKRVGAHQKRNRLVVDELQKCSDSVLAAMSNLGSIGEYQEFFIFNPASWFTADGKASAPAEPLTIQKLEADEPDEWPLARSFRGVPGRGICLDGERSPALTDPSLEGILIDKHHRETIVQNSGEDSFEYWSQFRGRMPPEGAVETFISRQDLEAQGCLRKPDLASYFQGATTDISGLDPSEGVDDCCIGRIRVGQRRSDGQTVIAIVSKHDIHIALKKGDISGQISTATVNFLRRWNLTTKDLAADATGGNAQCDRIEQDFGMKGIKRVMFQGPPTKRRISPANQTADQTYNDKATELFANVAALARQGRLVGLDDKMAHQLTTRRKLIVNGKAKVEPKDGKDGWRARNNGKSPNDLDSIICAVEKAINDGKIKPFVPVNQKQNQGFNRGNIQKPSSAFAARVRRASFIAGR